MPSIDRRQVLKGCGIGLAALVVPGWRVEVLRGQSKIHEVVINAAYTRGQWFFNPTGLLIEKGETVKWLNGKFGPTVTAFHPSNSNHELRIPKNAKPFDSGVLGYEAEKYRPFEWTFDVEGTYDYFSRTHEPLGLVGRIVVGAPGGPAEDHPPGYGGKEGRAPVFEAQKKMFAAVRSVDIVAKKSIAYPRDIVVRQYPFGEDD